ncbi:hypothetical protein ACFS2C_20425 [Prauserella oleivorans]|uniref:WXG100 family type VII secretion target n=1 Tax=Prauserella oleivorans TaxID=1478153 RepID=A0ABW5WHB2_9PSEU
MSGRGFGVDAERLGTHAAEFAGLTERAGRIVAGLRESLGTAPWGDDEVGRSFAAVHRRQADDTLAAIDGLAGGLTEMGEAFAAAARAYRSADDAAAGDVTDAGSAG